VAWEIGTDVTIPVSIPAASARSTIDSTVWPSLAIPIIPLAVFVPQAKAVAAAAESVGFIGG
jgi:hypothetical protein